MALTDKQKAIMREVRRLIREDDGPLSKDEKRRYSDFMRRDNSPSPAEFYGYDEELDPDEEPRSGEEKAGRTPAKILTEE